MLYYAALSNSTLLLAVFWVRWKFRTDLAHNFPHHIRWLPLSSFCKTVQSQKVSAGDQNAKWGPRKERLATGFVFVRSVVNIYMALVAWLDYPT